MHHDLEALPRWGFAFPGPIRDELTALALAGLKTATAALLVEFGLDGETVPVAGERSVLLDSEDRPVAIVETTSCRTIRLADVDDAHAIAEGEGYADAAAFRVSHERFWNGYIDELRAGLGDPTFAITDDTLITAERFRIVARLDRGSAQPAAIGRPYATDADADWWAIRDILLRSHAASPPAWNWDIRRWDGSRFHNEVPAVSRTMAAGIGLWETAGGRLVGAVHGEGGPGEAYLELDPDWRHLQPALLDWAEARLAAVVDGRRVLEVPAWDYDLPLRELLRERGYEERQAGTWLRRLRFGAWAIEVPDLAAGYRLRTTVRPGAESGSETRSGSDPALDADCGRMASLLNAAFGRSIHTAGEYRSFVMRSPSFRHDLNLVAEAPDGSFAAHAGFTLDQANRHGAIEPVCTHPDHRQRGLGRALILEGLRRLRDLGAVTCDVQTGDIVPANALYRSIGFTEEYRGHRWRRDLGPG